MLHPTYLPYGACGGCGVILHTGACGAILPTGACGAILPTAALRLRHAGGDK